MRFKSIRSLLPALTIAALAALATHSACAQSRFDISFNFDVSGHNCPAGMYTVERNKRLSVVTLRGAGHAYTWHLRAGDAAPNDDRVMLTFDRVGAAYALRTVQYRSQITARIEKKRKENTPEQIAMIGHESWSD